MNTRALALALVAVALGASACRVDNNTSVQVKAICAPPEDPTSCTFAATCDAQFIGISTFDASATSMLWLLAQLDNQTPNNADPDTYRTNTNDAYVTGISVAYTGPVAVPSWSEPIGPYLVPANGSAVVSIFPIDTSTPAAFDASSAITTAAATAPFRLTANVRLRGIYQDQREWETAELPVVVDVCNGCIGSAATFDCDTATSVIDAPAVCPPNFGQSPASTACP
jgi:hypothetical protein